MGFQLVMGVPLDRWMVYFMENLVKMDHRGFLYFKKSPNILVNTQKCQVWNSQHPIMTSLHLGSQEIRFKK